MITNFKIFEAKEGTKEFDIETLKINKLYTEDEIYDITKIEYDEFFWEHVDIQSLTYEFMSDFTKDYSIEKISTDDLLDYFIGTFGTGEIEEALGLESDEDATGVEDILNQYTSVDFIFLSDYFESENDLKTIYFENYRLEELEENREKLIPRVTGNPWGDYGIDEVIFNKYFENNFKYHDFYKEIIPSYEKRNGEIDVKKEYKELLFQRNIKKYQI